MMEAGGGGRQRDGGGASAVAEDPRGRGEYIKRLVERSEDGGMRVDPAVVHFILDRVLVSDSEWASGLEAGRFRQEWFEAKLEGALQQAAARARAEGETVINLRQAQAVYAEARERRECIWPFRKC
jgi:hypothetical protein